MQVDLAKRAGLAVSTISGIERGLNAHLRATSLEALDKALEWEPGMAAMLYCGMSSVRQAIRSLGAQPPRGARYHDLVRYLARLTDAEIEDIAKIIDERRLAIATDSIAETA